MAAAGLSCEMPPAKVRTGERHQPGRCKAVLVLSNPNFSERTTDPVKAQASRRPRIHRPHLSRARFNRPRFNRR